MTLRYGSADPTTVAVDSDGRDGRGQGREYGGNSPEESRLTGRFSNLPLAAAKAAIFNWLPPPASAGSPASPARDWPLRAAPLGFRLSRETRRRYHVGRSGVFRPIGLPTLKAGEPAL